MSNIHHLPPSDDMAAAAARPVARALAIITSLSWMIFMIIFIYFILLFHFAEVAKFPYNHRHDVYQNSYEFQVRFCSVEFRMKAH